MGNNSEETGITGEEKRSIEEEIAAIELELEQLPYDEPSKRNKYKTTIKNGAIAPVREFKAIRAITASELDKMDIPPIEWLVNKILPIGLSMIGAPSKYFKSFMALELCIAICNGGKFLDFDCNQFGCLYLDLESTERRPKSRLDLILGKGSNKPDNLYIITGNNEVGIIGNGFEKQVEHQLKEHPDIKLIIVDVFQMVRPPVKGNKQGYDRDYDDFKVLKKIADTYSIGLMLIHHTRKMKDPSDAFNNLSGSVGVMGALDCAWVIQKEDRNAQEAVLHITGRDMESQQYKIKYNTSEYKWQYIGTEDDINEQRFQQEYLQSNITKTIKKLLKQNNGHWEGSSSDIKDASKYLGTMIYDDARTIGKLINKYEVVLNSDRIIIDYKRKGSGRIYIFNDTNVTHDTNVIEQIKLDL